jgi:hypothetical protein
MPNMHRPVVLALAFFIASSQGIALVLAIFAGKSPRLPLLLRESSL